VLGQRKNCSACCRPSWAKRDGDGASCSMVKPRACTSVMQSVHMMKLQLGHCSTGVSSLKCALQKPGAGGGAASA